MDVDEAWAVLGLSPGDGWQAVRPAYRRLITTLHPDLAGPDATRGAARVNEAYAVLVRARRAGRPLRTPRDAAAPRPPPPPPPPAPSAPDPPPGAGPTHLDRRGPEDGGELLFLRMAPPEAFARLVAAGATLGDVGYVDRSSGVFETLVHHEGEVCSLLIVLEARTGGTEAFVALEALGRPDALSPAALVDRLVAALRA